MSISARIVRTPSAMFRSGRHISIPQSNSRNTMLSAVGQHAASPPGVGSARWCPPEAPLIADEDGNRQGTTSAGGNDSCQRAEVSAQSEHAICKSKAGILIALLVTAH